MDLCRSEPPPSGRLHNIKILKEELFIKDSLVEHPRGVVLITHGIGSHSGRNEEWIQTLNRSGYSVFSYDLPGHGRSRKKKWLFNDFDVLTEALDSVCKMAMKYGGDREIPLFLFGHSMGGLITIDYVIREQPAVDGVVLSAPALDPGEMVRPWMITLAGSLRKIVPGLPILKIPPSQLSRDPSVVQGYENDPLVFQGKIKVVTGYEMLSRMQFVMKNAPDFQLPVLILQGGADTIVRPEVSLAFFNNLSAGDKTLRSYPDMYHELLKDIGKEEVMEDILEWIDARISD